MNSLEKAGWKLLVKEDELNFSRAKWGKSVDEILRKLQLLKNNPFNYPYEKLQGKKDVYRIRFGDFRVIYYIDKGSKTILVLRIRKRESVYQGL